MLKDIAIINQTTGRRTNVYSNVATDSFYFALFGERLMIFGWERLDGNTERAEVIGGWLVRSRDVDACNSYYTVESMVFVPDEQHLWSVG